jgi:uncharacterized membrane protein
MRDILQQILYFFGNGLCHQYPERSFEAGGLYFGVCARDTGLYLGLVFTLGILIVWYARTRLKPAALPPAWAVVICVALAVPMAIDGASSYLGLRETTNLLRYTTGYLCGMGVAVLASGGLFGLWQNVNVKQSAVGTPSSFSVLLVASCAVGAAFVMAYPLLGIAAPLFAFVCQWAVFVLITLLVLSATPLWPALSGAGPLAVLIFCQLLAGGEMVLLSLLANGISLLFPWYVHP